MGVRPWWQNNPDPAQRVPWQVKRGVKSPLEMYDFKRKWICPHCGAKGDFTRGNKIFNHFAYCEKKDQTMSKEQLQEIVDSGLRPSKNVLMNQYGDFILSHNELLQVASTIALDKKDPRSILCIKLLFDYHDKMQNKAEEAEKVGFTQFVFEVIPPKPKAEEITDVKFMENVIKVGDDRTS